MNPRLIAHRGLSKRAPENTLESFLAAIDAGTAWIEFDVQLSADKEIVVIHDSTLQRTTNGYGMVAKRSLRELSSLDAGSWFGESFTGAKIPTLAEIFQWIPLSVSLDIEIKPAAVRGGKAEIMCIKLLELINSYQRNTSVLISSFSPQFLSRFREKDETLPTGLLHHGRALVKPVLQMLRDLKATWYLQNVLTVSKPLVRKLRENGITVGVFTANSERTLQYAAYCGVDYVVTDDIIAAESYYRLLQ